MTRSSIHEPVAATTGRLLFGPPSRHRQILLAACVMDANPMPGTLRLPRKTASAPRRRDQCNIGRAA